MATTATIPTTFGEMLEARARLHPERPALIFTRDGIEPTARFTYGELAAAARRAAAMLVEAGAAGERALLLYPHGPDFVIAFLGCLYAGAVAVPAYPPRPNRPISVLSGIVADCRPAVVLTTSGLVGELARRFAEEGGGAPPLRVLERDNATQWSDLWETPPPVADSLAFLQYTSGSTGEPKGAMVSHRNLMVNEAMITASSGRHEQANVVSWLPLYHDMGLIGYLLNPLYLGNFTVLMSPLDFMQRPVRWLRALSHYRAHSSGGPDSAYALCVERIKPQQMAGLDLSAWELAFSGSEPVRALGPRPSRVSARLSRPSDSGARPSIPATAWPRPPCLSPVRFRARRRASCPAPRLRWRRAG